MSRAAGTKASGVSHVRRGEAHWQELIERQRASGRSQVAFCRDEGVALSTFTYWARRISAGKEVSAAAVDFISLGEVVTAAPSTLCVRLDLGGGVTLEIRRG